MRQHTLIELGAAAAVIAATAIFAGFVETGALRDGVIRLCCLGLFALSLNLLVGYTGLLSFGHAMFFGMGAYAFAILLRTGGMGIPMAALVTVLMVALAAVLIGSLCVRLTHVYFSFLTLAIQMLFYSLLIAWSDLTGGEQGLIGGIPKPAFLGIDLAQPGPYLIFNVLVFVASVLVLRRIVTSPFGVALRLIRDNPQRAVFLGINVPLTKLAAFIIASVFASVAGMLMSLYVSGAYPNFAFWTMSGEGLFMIMLGGVTVFLGPVVGAGLLIILEAVVVNHSSYRGLALGVAILVSALGLRKGVLDFAADAFRRRKAGEVAARQATTNSSLSDSSSSESSGKNASPGHAA